MTKLARSSYIFVAVGLILVALLKLTPFMLTLLFSYLALSKLYYFRRKWLAVGLFAILMAGIAYGFIFFAKEAIVTLPKIAHTSIPMIIDYAEKHGVDVVAKMGDLFEPVADRAFEVIATVAPERGFESLLKEAPHHLNLGGELLTCVSTRADTDRFEAMLRDRFRFRALPESSSARNYLAMKL